METELFADIMVARTDAMVHLAAQIEITANAKSKRIMLEMMERVLYSVTILQTKAAETAKVLPFNIKE